MTNSAVRDQMMSEMTPTMSSSEGAPSRNVDEMTYSGDVPMSPACSQTCQSRGVNTSQVPSIHLEKRDFNTM